MEHQSPFTWRMVGRARRNFLCTSYARRHGERGAQKKESDDVIGWQAVILSEGCVQTSVARQGELIVLFGHAAHCVKQQQE